uniref:Uncharacterized protein n=1 Tax=Anopheles christyi TaxID=43041 RepID=A0A182KHN5_9DIPT
MAELTKAKSEDPPRKARGIGGFE